MSLGNGLGRIEDRVFRIGHMGDLGVLSFTGALTGVEMGLRAAGVPHKEGGVQAAMQLSGGAGRVSLLLCHDDRVARHSLAGKARLGDDNGGGLEAAWK